MAKYTTADLLRRCKIKLNRPATDEAFTSSTTDDVWYDLLTEAQDHVFQTLAAIAPDAMYSTLTLLTTADDGQTYTFGTDVDGAAISPIGHYELYATPNAYPGSPLVEGSDFIHEGTRVRAVNHQTMAAPYARFITPPNVLSAAVEPTLKPIYARALIADYACVLAAEQRLKQDGAPYREAYRSGLARVLLSIKTSALGQGGSISNDAWWRKSPDLG